MSLVSSLVCLIALPGTIVTVSGHASMLNPAPRNAIDSVLPEWDDGKHPETGWIEPYNCGCTNSTTPCNSGQACFWFSQGCTIGCKSCDGNGTRVPNFDHCPGESIKPTINDAKYRTVNQAAVPGSLADFTKYHPWRAPGKAPIFDSCGMAGGVDHEVFNAGAYNTTKFAKQGDLGSKVLPKRPSGVVWKKGSIVTSSWQNTAEHGGGYQWRLCPASEPLTEECFQKTPLDFAVLDKHTVVFKNRTMEINATVVPHSVTGTGEWMMNPLPYGNENCGACCDSVVPHGTHCDFHCPGCGPPPRGCYAADGACPVDCPKYPGLPHGGADSNYFKNQLVGIDTHTFYIEDSLKVPGDIAAGEYVLQWRWDCEATSQVWTNCADIEIADGDNVVV